MGCMYEYKAEMILTGPVISNLIRWIQVDLGGFKWVGFSTWKVGRTQSGGSLVQKLNL